MRLMIDAHLDLGWNAVSLDRDLTLSVEEIREQERGMTDDPGRGNSTVTLPELRRAGVAVAVATLLARSGPERMKVPGYKRADLDYAAPPIAFAAAHGQLAYYQLMAAQGHLRFIGTRRELDAHWEDYRAQPDRTPLGIILSMEGADPIVEPEQVDHWWNIGLRAVGLAHYGRGQYAYGTGVDGPLSERGVELVRRLERIGMILDATHLSEISFWQAMEIFRGPVLASHHNCRALVPGDRQLGDEQIKALIDRDAVIGVALDAWMLYPGWTRGETRPEVVSLTAAADHIDHVNQIAGSAKHSAIGSDLDGGFGNEQTPHDVKTIADLQKLGEILAARGYGDSEIAGIFHGNWLRFFHRALPA
jgi:membrane dipeptidase